MVRSNVNINKGRASNDHERHFAGLRCGGAPQVKDALTEICVFTYFSQQEKSPYLLHMLRVFGDDFNVQLVTEFAGGGTLFDEVAIKCLRGVGEEGAARYMWQFFQVSIIC